MPLNYHSQINRLESEIARLDKDLAAEITKQADLTRKLNSARESIERTSNSSSIDSKMRDIVRWQKDFASSKKKESDISDRRARKAKELRSYQERQSREDDKAHKKLLGEQRKLMRERETYERNLTSELRNRAILRTNSMADHVEDKEFDFFICHASEDKDDIVRPLANFLRNRGAKVWYDEFELTIGDRLREEIDRGLAKSKFGIVVLSENFFLKDWPQRELDGLFALENRNQKSILPIWHQLSKDKVKSYSPILVDVIAYKTSMYSVEEITDKLLEFI